jgi:SAM-dependent methyltransferase
VTSEAGGGRCRVCAGEVAFAFRARDRTGAAVGDHDYETCRACGGLQIARIPDDLDAAYGPAYYTARQRVPPPAWPPFAAVRRALSRARLGLGPPALARAVSGRRYGRFEWFRRTGTGLDAPILDVGCGSGRLLLRMHRDGFRSLVGIDPRLAPEIALRAARHPGLHFERATPEMHAGQHALVMAHHSLEHMPDPRGSFAALARLVRPGGWLLLRVPRADSFACARYRADWAQLDAPRHLHIPSRAGIERLAAESGLELVHVEDDSGVFQIWGSEAESYAHGPARLLRWLAARRQAARLRRAGQGDQLACYLRRPLT